MRKSQAASSEPVHGEFFAETRLMVATADGDLNVVFTNPSWCSLLGSASSLADALPQDFVNAIRAGHPIASTIALQCENGEFLWVRPLVERIAGRLTVVLADATDEVVALQAAEEARCVRDLLLKDAAVGTWMYDPDLDVYDFSPELQHLTPVTKLPEQGRKTGRIPRAVMDKFYHPDDVLLSRPMRERIVREGGSGSIELRLRNHTGTGWDHLRVMMRSGRRRPSGLHEMYGVSQVITELALARDDARQNAERVAALASRDVLTGLANRLTFEDRMRAAASAVQRGATDYAVLYIDLDRFKQVNDTLGHQAGDELIREVARRLVAVARTEDTVARLGGDEFAIVQHGADPNGAASFAERIIAFLSGPVRLNAGDVILSCSLGVAIVGRGGTNWEETLRQADVALYRAKSQGRGCYCIYEPEMDAALKSKKALEADLRQAIERDEIKTHYQPLVGAGGRIVAMEALARWEHASRGSIAPSVFIPLAEETDLIGPLGRATFKRICCDMARWSSIRVAVNVSVKQLRRPGFIDQVYEALDESGTPATRFDIEITESCILDDDAQTQEVLRRLRDMGCRLSLDDFGTGYSSLAYLQKYPIDQIKLDRSFISNLQDGARTRAVVNTIVQLARALDLELVAEGVETEQQFEILRDIGVEIFQGYLFSRPLPLLRAEEFLKRNRGTKSYEITA